MIKKKKKIKKIENFDAEKKCIKGLAPKTRFNNMFNKDRRYHIRMRLRNGDIKQMLVFSKDGTFIYGGGRYLIDQNCAVYDITAKCYSLEYHQDLSIPVKFSVNITEIKKAASDPRVSDIDAALNPYSLQKYGVSTVVEGMMKGASFDEWMKKQSMWTVAIFGLLTAFFLTFLIKTGVFQQVSGYIPGL